MPDNASKEPTPGKTPPRDFLYSQAAAHAPRAIEVLVEIMNKGDNDNARMGAAKSILAKAIPDLKAVEVTGANGDAIQLKYIVDLAGGYIPKLESLTTPPSGSNPGSTQIQSNSVAPQSTEDNNSTNGNNQAGTV